MDLREATAEPAIRHPWERARASFLDREMRRIGGHGPVSVLDVGSGDAWLANTLLAALPSGSDITCLDAHYDEVRVAALRATRDAGLSFVAEPPARAFDRIWLFDVLEHVERDTAFLTDLVRNNLAPGGRVTITVPAWSFLFSDHDVALGHFRRYAPAAIRAVISDAGLAIERSGGLFHGLLLPRLAKRASERVNPWRGSPPNLSTWNHGVLMTTLIERGLVVDNRVSAVAGRLGIDLPGSSWWATCRAR